MWDKLALILLIIGGVNWTQWQCILQHALAQGGGAELVALEVNEWAEDTFRDHAVFTILGI